MSNKPTVKDSKIFQSAIKELGYNSVGEFISITAALALLGISKDDADKERLTSMVPSFADHCGYILLKLGHLEELQQKQENLDEADALEEEAKENEKNTIFVPTTMDIQKFGNKGIMPK